MKVGINGNLKDETLSYFEELGVSLYRESLIWSDVQPTPDVWDWSKPDRIAKCCRQLGLMWIPTIIGPLENCWQQELVKENDMCSIIASEYWKEFLEQAVERYSDIVDIWEIWPSPMCKLSGWKPNENLRSYVWFVRTTYNIIKKKNPNTKVMAGSIGPQINTATFYELLSYGLLIGPDCTDALGFQFYWLNENNTPTIWNGLVDGIRNVRAIIRDLGSQTAMIKEISADQTRILPVRPKMPLWITETGWPVNDELNEFSPKNMINNVQMHDDQTAYHRLERTLYYSKILDIEAVIIHTMIDEPCSNFWKEHCGLIKPNGEKRMSFYGIKNFIKQHGG